MYINHYENVTKNTVTKDGAEKAFIRWLLTEKDNADHFDLRYLTFEPGGTVPVHSHDIVHAWFFLKGKGTIITDKEEIRVEAGNFIYLDSNEVHGVKNTGTENFEFICFNNR